MGHKPSARPPTRERRQEAYDITGGQSNSSSFRYAEIHNLINPLYNILELFLVHP